MTSVGMRVGTLRGERHGVQAELPPNAGKQPKNDFTSAAKKPIGMLSTSQFSILTYFASTVGFAAKLRHGLASV